MGTYRIREVEQVIDFKHDFEAISSELLEIQCYDVLVSLSVTDAVTELTSTPKCICLPRVASVNRYSRT